MDPVWVAVDAGRINIRGASGELEYDPASPTPCPIGGGVPRPAMPSDRELTQTYTPNPILRALYQRFFDKIQVDEAWVREVRALSERG